MDYSIIHSYTLFGQYAAIWCFIQGQAAYIIKTQVYSILIREDGALKTSEGAHSLEPVQNQRLRCLMCSVIDTVLG